MSESLIYITTPAITSAQEIRAELDTLTRSVAIAAVRLRLAPGHAGGTIIRDLEEVVQNRDVALLIEDDIEFAQRFGADGVHLTNYINTGAARQRLGEESNIGAHCFASRHAAFEAGEAGADYVSFSPADTPEVVELVSWWSEMTTLPCLIEGVKDQLTARRLLEAGADFISLPLRDANPDVLNTLANYKL